MIGSWLLDLDRDGAARRARTCRASSGRVSDSGEGRWTVAGGDRRGRAGAGDQRGAVWRFSSRGEEEFGDKLLSAMRFDFGGHVEKPAAAA